MKNRLFLGLGAAFGLVLAVCGAIVPSTDSLSANVVARVNGKPILSQDLAFALARLHEDGATSSATHAEALNYLIDQELLVQRGVAIGLVESDHTVRKAIAMAMIDAIVAEVLAKEPSDKELRTFYGFHRAVFATPARLHLQHVFCGGSRNLVEARARAEQAREALTHGLSVAEVRERYGDADAIALPDELTPLVVIRRALGPTLSDAVLALQVGEVTLVPVAAVGYYVFRLVSRQDEQVQTYEAVKQEVRAEYFRRKRDEALQQYLNRWRRDAVIVLSPKVQRLDMIANSEHTTGP